MSLFVYLFKIKYIPDIRPAKSIDGLIVISDDTEVSVLFCKKRYQHKLRHVRILILIHHYTAVFILIVLQYIGICLENCDHVHYEIIEIHLIVCLQSLLIFPIGFHIGFHIEVTLVIGCEILYCLQFILCSGYDI